MHITRKKERISLERYADQDHFIVLCYSLLLYIIQNNGRTEKG